VPYGRICPLRAQYVPSAQDSAEADPQPRQHGTTIERTLLTAGALSAIGEVHTGRPGYRVDDPYEVCAGALPIGHRVAYLAGTLIG